MTERRAVRSSSRRITLTPQPTITAATPQPTGGSRRRATRSASRRIADRSPSPARHLRRSSRPAHAPTVPPHHQDEQDNRPQSHVAKEEPLGDLSTVEEAESHMDLEAVPQSTPRRRPDTRYTSPDQLSQISGTTAVTSFSMVEGERLDAEDIQESIGDLYATSTKFLHFLVPEDGAKGADRTRIHELRKPDSKISKRFQRLERALHDDLDQFRTEGEEYIRLGAVRRALHRDRDQNAPLLGVDLIMYLANLLIFVKRMITSETTSEEGSGAMFDALRPLDRHFPSYLLPEVTDVAPGSAVAGESALVDPTIDLALELRAQLAILVLNRSWAEPDSDPEFSIREVFYQKDNEELTSALRGWPVPGLQAEHLSDHARAMVKARAEKLMALAANGGGLETLESGFPWESVMLRLLEWARERHRELQVMIAKMGGIEQIRSIAMGKTEPLWCAVDLPSRTPPRRSRTSFTKDQRRRSGRLSLGGAAKDDIFGALFSMPQVVRHFGGVRSTRPRPPADARARAAAHNDGWRVHSVLTDADRTLVNDHDMTMTETEALAPVADDPVLPQGGVEAEEEIRETIEGEGAPSAREGPSRRHGRSGPPQSVSDLVKLIKQTRNKGKENGGDFFARQATAQRIEFGDGFDGEASQPIPSPSRRGKERVPATTRKRRMLEEDEDEDGEDGEEAFETRQGDGRAAERRREAPVAKKVRLELPWSGGPPSHQPPAARRALQEGSVSESEAREMTEEAPVATYSEVLALSKRNARTVRREEGRKPRAEWTRGEIAAFEEYMAEFPRKYAAILDHDKTSGHRALQHRNQGHLKDKARNMAINYIKSGTGLPSGFEDVISPTSKLGMELLAAGFQW